MANTYATISHVTCEWVVSHMNIWRMHMRRASFILMWHGSLICDTSPSYGTWLIHPWHDSRMYDMTYLFIRDLTHWENVTWLRGMTHSFTRDMTHSYVTQLIHILTHSHVVWLTLLRHCHYSSHFHSCREGANGNMGWLRLVGSLKLWVSFAEYSLFYRALLQKRPMVLRNSSDVRVLV